VVCIGVVLVGLFLYWVFGGLFVFGVWFVGLFVLGVVPPALEAGFGLVGLGVVLVGLGFLLYGVLVLV
jgi:hypothetical protein